MEKVIDNKRYFLYSSLSQELKIIYYSEIYKFVHRLVFEYRGFEQWFHNLFSSTYDLRENRDIVICEDNLTLAGIAIIKNECDEKKICTLRVAKEFQNQGIGHRLVELCFQQLDTDKPMITLHKSKYPQFEKILNYYNFQLEQTQKNYYKYFSTELVFNGFLPQKDYMMHHIRLVDMEELYKKFMFEDRLSFENHVDKWIRYWYKNAQRI